MKNQILKSSKKQKISVMVLKVAGDYIDMGETTEEREKYLRSACTAWNIACLPSLKREAAIRQYIEQYQEINKADEADCKAMKEDITLLIKQKNALYPYINVQIVDARIENINGRESVTVLLARIE